MEQQAQNEEFANKVFEQFLEPFVMPEVERSQDIGELE